MTSPTLPAPGSLAARDLGCLCSAFMGPQGRRMAIVPARCPLHGAASITDSASLATDNGEARSVSPARLPGDAWGGR